MSLIDTTYFTGPLTIAQLGQKAVDDSVNDFIALHEPRFIEAALGYGFAQSFQAGLLEDPIQQKWLDIRDGLQFTNLSGYQRKWFGFANSTTKISPIANYVYFMFQENICMQAAGIGVVKADAENSSVISPSQKMTYAWNEMSKMLVQLWDYLYITHDTYDADGYFSNEIQRSSFRPVNIFGI